MCGFIDGAVADCTNASRSSLNGGRAGSSGGKHIFFSGYMRADATFTSCRSGCTLGAIQRECRSCARGRSCVQPYRLYGH